MQQQSRSVTLAVAVPAHAPEASNPSPTAVPRRRLLRTLSGVAMGVVALVALTSCGGEDDGEDEDDD